MVLPTKGIRAEQFQFILGSIMKGAEAMYENWPLAELPRRINQMTSYWCLNFDKELVLKHGLRNNLWAMQYQYAHGGHTYQGYEPARITVNWKVMMRINVGDWCLAYLKPSRFYAIARVIEPRKQPTHTDSINATLERREHRYYDGVIRYRDAPAFYEDFTDRFQLIAKNASSQHEEPEKWPQRIDVDKWEYLVPAGAQVEGLSDANPNSWARRNAAFEIEEWFFDEVKGRLRQ